MTRTTAPEASDVELSVVGPGYGEALAVHLGNGSWMLVDSCVAEDRPFPCSLSYLDEIGVEPSAVALIVATHWHDDHIRGLATLLERCDQARFYCSAAFRNRSLLKLVKAMEPEGMTEETSGVSEFGKVLAVLAARKTSGELVGDAPGLAIANKVIHRAAGEPPCVVTGLSPSDAAVVKSLESFAQLLPVRLAPKRRVAAPKSNVGSAALWVEVGFVKLLLGADLEKTQPAELGWDAVLRSTERPQGQANAYKIAHHGSKTGHHEDVWSTLLVDNPPAATTPYANGRHRIPSGEERAVIAELTTQGFMAGATPGRPQRSDSAVERTIRETTRSFTRALGRVGQIRFRCSALEPGAPWRIEKFGQWEHLRVPTQSR